MPARVNSQRSFSLVELPAQISKIFDQAQITTANHQKNYVSLYKLHSEAADVTESVRNGTAVKLVGERRFEEELMGMLVRVLPIKKGVAPADKVIKFVGGYTRFVNEKAEEEKAAAIADGTREEDEEFDTKASRFTAHLLRFLITGFESKDKFVRYRVLSTVAEMVSHLGEVDEDIYKSLRTALLDRITDRESSVRIQAVISLSKLCGPEDTNDLEEGEQSVLAVLLEALAYDTSPEVRRATLLNIPVNATTLSAILDRTRDTDTTIRKLVYHTVLQSNMMQGEDEVMGCTHPRVLSIAQRELIVKNGLGDREPSVRAAAGSLLGEWVAAVTENEPEIEAADEDDTAPRAEDADVTAEAKDVDNKAAPKKSNGKSKEKEKEKGEKVEAGVLALLKLFDLTATTIAADALLSVFATQLHILDNIEFGDEYWSSLTPERAFLARVFVDYCLTSNTNNDLVRLEAALPVVTLLAFCIQEGYNTLVIRAEEIELLKSERELTKEEKDAWGDERDDGEFMIGEMLTLAVNLDYGDEIGRRKMFQLIRDMLSQPSLPDSLVTRCLDVLTILAPDERELIRIGVELIRDLRDAGEEEEEEDVMQQLQADLEDASSPGSPTTPQPARAPVFNRPVNQKTPGEKAKADRIDLRCLTLCAGMLERVNSNMDDHSTLDGIFTDLIIPAVKRPEPEFREKGFVCLGLCCLIAHKLALQLIDSISKQAQLAQEPIKLTLIKVMFDILMVHDNVLLQQDPKVAEEVGNYFIGLLDSDPSDTVLALLCVGISKLMLSRVIVDDDVMRRLIRCYFSPNTQDNQELRQCLTFFFPVYCYSSTANQRVMVKNFVQTYLDLRKDREQLEDPQDMISVSQVAAQLADWTDPLKLSKSASQKVKSDEGSSQQDVNEHEAIQVELAMELIQALCTDKHKLSKEDKKIFCQLLGKLHIPDQVDEYLLKRLKLLMYGLRLRRPIRDNVSNNAFTKFEAMILKKFEKQLEDFNEEDYRKMEELNDLFEFLDDIVPMDNDEVVDIHEATMSRKRGRKRSESVSSTSTESEEYGSDSPPPSGKKGKQGKGPAKRRRLSDEDGADPEEDEKEDRQSKSTTPPVSAPTRIMPKRAATKKPQVDKILEDLNREIEEDDEDNEDNDEEEEEEGSDLTEISDQEEEERPRKRAPAAASNAARPSAREQPAGRKRSPSVVIISSDDEARKPTRQSAKWASVKQPPPIKEEDEEDSREHPHDSIMDESEEEEDEVNDTLLVGE